MRKIFFEKLKEILKRDPNIFLLFGDLGSKFFAELKAMAPDRVINVGVAEQNMIGVAAGLAMSGKNVYCYSIIPFLTMRTFEQIRVDLCYHNLNVKLLGAGGGLVYGLEGVTHHSIEDIAIMRSLPNMTVAVPGDVKEAEAMVGPSASHKGPLYIRFGRDTNPVVHEKNFKFEFGRGIIMEEGKDICLIAIGSMLASGKNILSALRERGLNPSLISMPTVKPLDEDLIRDCAKKYKFIFTLEDHSIIGGLGGATAEVLAEAPYAGNFRRFGIPDKYSCDIGGPDYLRDKSGLCAEKICQTILEELKNN